MIASWKSSVTSHGCLCMVCKVHMELVPGRAWWWQVILNHWTMLLLHTKASSSVGYLTFIPLTITYISSEICIIIYNHLAKLYQTILLQNGYDSMATNITQVMWHSSETAQRKRQNIDIWWAGSVSGGAVCSHVLMWHAHHL